MIKLTAEQRAREMEIAEKMVDFDWYSKRPADQEKLTQYADTVYDIFYDRLTGTDQVPAIFNYVKGKAGVKIKARRNYGGKVFERSYGEFKRVSHIKTTHYSMTTTPAAVHLDPTVEELRAGIILPSELAEMAVDAIKYHRLKMIWSTLKTALPSTDSDLCTNLGTSITQSDLDTAIDTLGDKAMITAIWGRRPYIGQIFNFSGYDGGTGYPDSVKEELHRRGALNFYKGIPVFLLPEARDEVYTADATDTGNLFLITNKREYNRFVEVTPPEQKYEVTIQDGRFHLIYDIEDGFAVWETRWMHRGWDGTAGNA